MADRQDQMESVVDSDIVQLLQTLGATPVNVETRPAQTGGFDVTIRLIGPFFTATAAEGMAAHIITELLALMGVPVA